MSVNTNIKNYLLDNCYDLDLVAKKIDRDPEDFKNALDEKYNDLDQRNLTLTDLHKICQITKEKFNNILNYQKG